ncbi:MAG: protein-tyrosine phosphatase [Halieaceae bacterium]|jgi:protein-tyrosine phosphatase
MAGNRRGQRHIKLQGTPNFRDFGGYTNTAGKSVKWGYLFRSGHLADLTVSDTERVADLELELICDFRQEEEQLRERSRLPDRAKPRVEALCITPGNLLEMVTRREDNHRSDMFDFMVSINRDFALGQRDQYAAMFQHMLDTEQGRTLVHCAAGKDRTGFAAAIILMSLGVSRETVMVDYLLTSQYFFPDREVARIAEKYALDMDPESVLPMLEVHPEYLQAALAAIDEHYPSIDDYLSEHLGVDASALAELRRRYLD